MDKSRACKICNRRFANGKAMGGHMRSHLAKLPIPSKPDPAPQPDNLTCSSSSSLNYPPPDRETEWPRKLTGRRSKRQQPGRSSAVEEQVSSVSDNDVLLTEGDVAMCLLMLSNDKWKRQEELVHNKDCAESENEEEKYKCLLCNKVFRSYQALGGHKSSHKKAKISSYNSDMEEEYDEMEELDEKKYKSMAIVYDKQRIFKCSICDKVFDSGQALGGHKKVHFSYLGCSGNFEARKPNLTLLDLNLPAPEDEGEVTEV